MGSITAQHFGEKKTIERARTLGEWKNMDQEIITMSGLIITKDS